MNEQEIKNLLEKVQAGELQLPPEQKLELLKEANQKVIALNGWLKDLI